jgi:BlaI family transcriptional regulator, penicillinase repressor
MDAIGDDWIANYNSRPLLIYRHSTDNPMARPKTVIPTPAEQRALNFLHEHGSATVRDYLEKGDHRAGRAYTSVMSLLSVMYDKGLATRTEEGRAFRYKPAMAQTELRAAVVNNVLDNVFAGDHEAFKAAVAAAKSGRKK